MNKKHSALAKRPRRATPKRLVIAGLTLLILAGAGYWLLHRDTDHKAAPQQPVTIGGVNYGPPTKEEIKETEQHKQELEKKLGTGNTPPPPSTSKQANVIVTYASVSETRGYVGNVFEDGGTCTATFTKGSVKVSGTSSGITDVNKTTCPAIAIDPSKLSSGDWTVVLSYSSSTASGTSESKTVSVP